MRFGFLILASGLLVGCGASTTSDFSKCETALVVMDNLNDATPDINRAKTIADITVNCKSVFSKNSAFKKIAHNALKNKIGTAVEITFMEVSDNEAVEFDKALWGNFKPGIIQPDGDSHTSFLFYVERKSYKWALQTY